MFTVSMATDGMCWRSANLESLSLLGLGHPLISFKLSERDICGHHEMELFRGFHTLYILANTVFSF